MHTQIYTYTYIYMYVSFCVCIFIKRVREALLYSTKKKSTILTNTFTTSEGGQPLFKTPFEKNLNIN